MNYSPELSSALLREAIKSRDVLAAIKAIEVYNINLEKELEGTTWLPLAYAAMHDDPPMIRTLISFGANLDGRSGALEFSALHAASFGNACKSCQALIDLGAELFLNDKNRCTAIHIASRLRHMEVVKILIDGSLKEKMSL